MTEERRVLNPRPARKPWFRMAKPQALCVEGRFKIQEARISKGFLQEDVAAALGISRVAVGYIEQGRRNPKLATLYEMARLFDVDIRVFFGFLDDGEAGLEGKLASDCDESDAFAD